LKAAGASDWKALDPESTLYLETASGRVVIELLPAFAPQHVANIKALARAGYFDGLAVLRVQDNYVVQWGDPAPDDKPAERRPLGKARAHLPAEFVRPSSGLPFTPLRDGDVYAPVVGWSDGAPVAMDPKRQQAWVVHCYGVVGAGREDAPDSSNGAELYAVIGHAPRHLDRNMTLVGRAVWGLEKLSALPRGSGPLGFYEKAADRVPIVRVRLAVDVPPGSRTALERLRTDTPTFGAWLEARRNRREPFFVEPQGHVDLCNVPIPVRLVGAAAR
jgi:peptidylprolyl isomerase